MARNQPEQDFIKALRKLDNSRSDREKFTDLMEMAYCAFSKPVAATQEAADALEARYMGIVGRYQNKDTVRAYPDLLGIAIKAVQSGGCDFLGNVAGELEVLNARQGQFFTPYSVARMMATMNLADAPAVIAAKGYTTIGDPAVGAGAMLLAAADVLEQNGVTLATQVWMEGVDLNQLAFYMCYLQLAWRGVPALVKRGNSLSLEVFEQAITPMAVGFLEMHGYPFAPKPEPKPEPPAAPKPLLLLPARVPEREPAIAAINPVQLSLWGDSPDIPDKRKTKKRKAV